MKTNFLIAVAISLILSEGCRSKSQNETYGDKGSIKNIEVKTDSTTKIDVSKIKIADAKTIMSRKQVPILCYHQVRNWIEKDEKIGRDYIIPIQNFKDQMKMLADSGYHSILLHQLYAYLTQVLNCLKNRSSLLLMIPDMDQFTVARPTLEKFDFKAVYFIMTFSMGRKGKFVDYMTKEQINNFLMKPT